MVDEKCFHLLVCCRATHFFVWLFCAVAGYIRESLACFLCSKEILWSDGPTSPVLCFFHLFSLVPLDLQNILVWDNIYGALCSLAPVLDVKYIGLSLFMP